MGHRRASSQASLGWTPSPPGCPARRHACPDCARPYATVARRGLAPDFETRARIPDPWPHIQGLAMGYGPRPTTRFRLARGC
eukprot:6620382-Pyramimonas_sp.AAC.1